MRKIKLSGRELAVVRAIDFANGELGSEIQARTHLETADLVDVLNALLASGYIETDPLVEHVDPATFSTLQFEINPGYVPDLREAISRR